jgi:branched-chain amino acid transport system permease protein
MAGVAGCLYAANSGQPSIYGFRVEDSLTLLATTLIGGIFSLWGAIVAGLFSQLLPFLFQAEWGLNANFLLIIFGVGILQVLLTAPGGLVDQFPKDMAKLGRLLGRLAGRATGARGGAAA